MAFVYGVFGLKLGLFVCVCVCACGCQRAWAGEVWGLVRVKVGTQTANLLKALFPKL